MNKLDMIEALIKKIGSGGIGPDQEDDLAAISVSIDAFIDYHNEAVRQGALISFAKFRSRSDEEFIDYVSALHERRKDMHQRMIDSAVALNAISRKYGMPDIYEGPLDADKGRSDDDTRFGVARMCEELCRDLFKTSETTHIPEKAREAYHKFHSDIVSDYDERGKRPGAKPGFMEMLRKAEARNAMDAGEQAGNDGPDGP